MAHSRHVQFTFQRTLSSFTWLPALKLIACLFSTQFVVLLSPFRFRHRFRIHLLNGCSTHSHSLSILPLALISTDQRLASWFSSRCIVLHFLFISTHHSNMLARNGSHTGCTPQFHSVAHFTPHESISKHPTASCALHKPCWFLVCSDAQLHASQ